MGSGFLSFWKDVFCNASVSAFSVTALYESITAIYAAAFYAIAREWGPQRVREILSRPKLSWKWILLWVFLVLFFVHVFVVAPYLKYDLEYRAKLIAQNDTEKARKELRAVSASVDPQEISRLRSELKKYQDLAAQNAKTEWPKLTDKQIKEWVRQLEPYHIKELAVFWGANTNPKNFFKSLQTVGKKLGIKVTSNSGGFKGTGIAVWLPANHPSAQVLTKLIKEDLKIPLKIEYSVSLGPQISSLCLFIGDKS